MTAPTPVSALVHSSTLVTAGVYLLIRSEPGISSPFFCVRVATLFLASVGACITWDVKRLIAYSTISHIRVMCASLGCGQSATAFAHTLNHAVLKSLLFFTAGALISVHQTQDVRGFRMTLDYTPITCFGFMVALSGIRGAAATLGATKGGCMAGASVNAGACVVAILFLSSWYCTRVYMCIFHSLFRPRVIAETLTF